MMIVVNPTYRLTEATLPILKKAAEAELKHVQPARRMEAVARALGYGSYAALRADLPNEPHRSVDGKAFAAFLERPGEASIPLAAHRIMARVAIRVAAEREPKVHHYGYGRYTLKAISAPRSERKAVADAEFEGNRKALFAYYVIDEFLRAHALASALEKIKSPNRKRGSYGLKHDAERAGYRLADGTELSPNYVANGTMIAAAIYAGFEIYPDTDGGPNVQFNISERSRNAVIQKA